MQYTSRLLALAVAWTLVAPLSARAQATPPPAAGGMQSSQGGMANAGPQTPEFDSQQRPITAGGFVKSGPVVFQDVAKAAGSMAPGCLSSAPGSRTVTTRRPAPSRRA